MSVEAKRVAIFWISLSVSTQPCRAIQDLLSEYRYIEAWTPAAQQLNCRFSLSPAACRARPRVRRGAIRTPDTHKAATAGNVPAENGRCTPENPGSNVWPAICV